MRSTAARDDGLLLADWAAPEPAEKPGPGWLGTRPRPILLSVGCVVLALAAGVVAPAHVKYAVGIIALAGVVGAVMLRPMIGALLLVGLVPITSGLATGFPVPHLRLSEAVIGVVGITLLVSVRRRDAVAWQAVDWALAAYAGGWLLFAVAADVSLSQHLSLDQWGTAFGQLQFLLVYRGVRVAVRSSGERRIAVETLILSSSLVSMLAILQKLDAPGVRSLLTKITGGTTAGTAAMSVGHILRTTGPFSNWAALAGFILPILLVLLALALAGVDSRRRRWFLLTGLLGAVALVLTDEQSAIICMAVGAIVLVRQYGRGRTLLRWAPLLLVLVAAIAGPNVIHRLTEELGTSAGTGRVGWIPQTISFRWSVWTQQYLPAIGLRPLTGYGMVIPSTVRWPWPESQYISFLIEGGVTMLALFAALAWAMLGGAKAAARSADPMERAMGRALIIAVVSMLAMNIMWPFLSNGGMPQVLWALLALAVPRRRAGGIVGTSDGDGRELFSNVGPSRFAGGG